MIDLHCHILPALDDGAVDLADSVAMARQAFDDGIEVICATPHIRRDHEVAIGELAARVAEVDEKLASLGIDVRVVGGGEVAEAALAGLDASELDRVALGGGSWVLLEPAPGPLTDSLRDAVDGLRRRGYRSLIAHPERNAAADTAERLADLVDRGGAGQTTAGHELLTGPRRRPGRARRRGSSTCSEATPTGRGPDRRSPSPPGSSASGRSRRCVTTSTGSPATLRPRSCAGIRSSRRTRSRSAREPPHGSRREPRSPPGGVEWVTAGRRGYALPHHGPGSSGDRARPS